MQVKLITQNKTSQEFSEVLLEVEDKVIVGRDLSSPVLLQGEAISRQHFSIALKDGQLTVESLGSNGTMLNGMQLPVKESVPVVTGDLLELPDYEIRVEVPIEIGGGGADAGARNGMAAGGGPAWRKAVTAALGFFDPLEALLVLSVLATIALTMYYLAS